MGFDWEYGKYYIPHDSRTKCQHAFYTIFPRKTRVNEKATSKLRAVYRFHLFFLNICGTELIFFRISTSHGRFGQHKVRNNVSTRSAQNVQKYQIEWNVKIQYINLSQIYFVTECVPKTAEIKAAEMFPGHQERRPV